MRILRVSVMASGLVVNVLLGSLALATIMPELTVEEMTKKSALVLVGKVESVACKWNSDQTTILTYARIVPVLFLAGRTEEKFIVVELLGGTVGNITTTAVGEAVLKANEEVVVFLTRHQRTQPNAYQVVGHAQGKFRIIKSPDTNRMLVERDLIGISFMGSERASEPKFLDELIKQIENVKK